MKITLPPLLINWSPDAYLVGGAVRDLIQGRCPTDFDMAVLCDPESFARRLASKNGGHWVMIGKNQLRVHRVICGQHIIDISAIKGRNIISDLLARDFTVNALACDPSSGHIIDCTGGLNDLRRKVIRMVPPANMLQDPVRLLRAYRLSAGLRLKIEDRTRSSIKTHAAHIRSTAGERIWAELRMIMASNSSHSQIVGMAESGLLQAILPELGRLKNCPQNAFHSADVWEHTLAAYAAMEMLLNNPANALATQGAAFVQSMSEESRILMKFSILLHDLGKPQSLSIDSKGKIRFINHAALGVHLVRGIGRRLRMSKAQCEWIASMVGLHHRPMTLFLCQQGALRASRKALGRFLRICAGYTPYLLLHALADTQGKGPASDQCQNAMLHFLKSMLGDYFSRIRPMIRQAPLLTGNDLIEIFHLQPSPALGRLLNRLLEAQLSGIIHDRQQAQQWLNNFLDQRQVDSNNT